MKDDLARKYRGRKFDLVFILDNPALEMALRYRQELFPGTPLVFAGVNDFRPSMLAGQEKVTGVAEVLNIARHPEDDAGLAPRNQRGACHP